MKYALITGASGGIGSKIAAKLADEGWNLYLHYHRSKDKTEHLKKELENKGISCLPVQGDLSTKDGVNGLLGKITHPIQLLVLSSGTAPYGLITDLDDEEIQAQVQLHVTSPFLLAKSLIPNMVSAKKGSIIAITSIWGEKGASCEVLYSMVKGGQNTFVKALAKELAPSGIRVNAVSPGAVDTGMLSRFTEEDLREMADDIPAGRIGRPEEIADAVCFLASEKSSYITGHILSVNGGWD
ncbi:elongation factor P 5-aminopentanone reductase [Bacillus sp. SJS]|uniref:elongation factor P 5-aminopentanone reductase n=1 Tax=Bacillus sp. SJS TaxID=1423321 RepID=UPI0004DD1CDF|nr:SDR family oxidoreductase [Bacillus sp. SJS]KZZ82782.1 3-ketoacyl-ACP reductase [Bacillus sp. SJS]